MANSISVFGCGRTGIQTAVYLLEQFDGNIVIYDDDTSYARGMALDCMQAASVEGYRGNIRVATNIRELQKTDILVICEQRDEKPTKLWEKFVHTYSGMCIYTCQDLNIFKKFLVSLKQKQLPKIFAVHGVVDAGILGMCVAEELNISEKDVELSLKGGVAANMKSKEEWVRVAGIPIEEIQKGSYKKSLEMAQKYYSTYKGKNWNFHYAFAAAAAKTAKNALSEKKSVMSITTGKGTIPAMVSEKGYVVYNNLQGVI